MVLIEVEATKYYIDKDGNYLGAFGPGVDSPLDAIEIDQPPDHGNQKRDINNNSWLPYVPVKGVPEQLNDLFETLPIDEELKFYPVKVQVVQMLAENRIDLVKALINSVTVDPQTEPNSQAVKDNALKLIGG